MPALISNVKIQCQLMGNGSRARPSQTKFGGKRQISRRSVCAERSQRDFRRKIARINRCRSVNRHPARTDCFADSYAERDSASGLCRRQTVTVRIGRRGDVTDAENCFQARDGNLYRESGMVGNRNVRRCERRTAIRVDRIADTDRMRHGNELIRMIVGDSRNVSGLVHGGDMDVKFAAGRARKSIAVRCGRNATVRNGIGGCCPPR